MICFTQAGGTIDVSWAEAVGRDQFESIMRDEANYYELLDLKPGASDDEVKAAYRSVVQACHPDKGGNSGLIRLVTQARDTLLDPEKRGEYDLSIGLTTRPPAAREADPSADGGGPQPGTRTRQGMADDRAASDRGRARPNHEQQHRANQDQPRRAPDAEPEASHGSALRRLGARAAVIALLASFAASVAFLAFQRDPTDAASRPPASVLAQAFTEELRSSAPTSKRQASCLGTKLERSAAPDDLLWAYVHGDIPKDRYGNFEDRYEFELRKLIEKLAATCADNPN